jgi:predicted metal-binding membrane protein
MLQFRSSTYRHMNDTALESVLRRDRMAVLAAIVLLTALSWVYLLWLKSQMSMPAMPGMDIAAMAPQTRSWGQTDLLFAAVMWVVMMAGMMLPSVAPIILLYARVGRRAEAQQAPFAATGWFAGGYLLAWIGFSLLATLLQAVLTHAALLTPTMASASNILGGMILVIAGVYQWTSLKDRCLANCRAPLSFIQRHGGFQRRALPSLQLGARHGLYCIGCCGTLMLLLFVGGVMNLTWIAGIAALILLEKVLTEGRAVSRVFGLGLIVGGVTLAFYHAPV